MKKINIEALKIVSGGALRVPDKPVARDPRNDDKYYKNSSTPAAMGPDPNFHTS